MNFCFICKDIIKIDTPERKFDILDYIHRAGNPRKIY